MIYCDTSLIVALVTEEVHTALAEAWLRGQAQDELAASAWVGTEVASALALKHRMGVLDDAAHAAAMDAATGLLDVFANLAVEERHFVAAQHLVATPPGGLRAGDALHLAIAVDRGCGLAALDRALLAAAAHLGVELAIHLPS